MSITPVDEAVDLGSIQQTRMRLIQPRDSNHLHRGLEFIFEN